jgi:prevent-host-death family protein
MKTAGIADLKARLSEYLDRVKAGNEVLVTERGTPIAKLVPLDRAVERDSREERLARKGLLVLGRGRFRKALLAPPEGDPGIGAGVLAALLEERREGR